MNIIDLEFKLVTLSYVMLTLTYNLFHVKKELLKLVFDIKRIQGLKPITKFLLFRSKNLLSSAFRLHGY